MFSERERGSESEPSSELAVPAEAEAVAAAAEQLPMEVLVGSEPSKPLEPSKSCEPGAEEEDVDVVHESDHEEYSYRDSDNESDIDDAPPLANFSEAAQILLAERASLEEFRRGQQTARSPAGVSMHPVPVLAEDSEASPASGQQASSLVLRPCTSGLYNTGNTCYVSRCCPCPFRNFSRFFLTSSITKNTHPNNNS